MNYALIPAAGKSTRMGRPKLSLPLQDRSIIEHVIHALRHGGVGRILVVIGPHCTELAPLATAAGAHVLALNHATADMRATVEEGFLWLENHFAPNRTDRWLLVPADHPTLDAALVRELLLAAELHDVESIIIPTCDGKRGHPAVFSWKHADEIRQWTHGEGINAYLRRHADNVCEIPVASAEILRDLDTPQDYEQLLRR